MPLPTWTRELGTRPCPGARLSVSISNAGALFHFSECILIRTNLFPIPMIPGNNSTRSVGSISEGRNDLTTGRSVELSERSIDAEEQVPFLPGTSDPALPRSQSNMSSSRFMSIVVTLAKNGLVRQLLLLGFLFSVCWCMIFVFFLPVMDPVDRERLQYSNSFESAHEKVTFKRILL